MVFATQKPFTHWNSFRAICIFLQISYTFVVHLCVYIRIVCPHIQMKAPCSWNGQIIEIEREKAQPNESRKKKTMRKNNIICIVVCCMRAGSISIASCHWSFLWFSFAACWLLLLHKLQNNNELFIKNNKTVREPPNKENQVQGQHNGLRWKDHKW